MLAACPSLSPTTLPGGEHPDASSRSPLPGRSTVTGRGLTWPIPRVRLLWIFSGIRFLGLLRTLWDVFQLCLCSRRGEAQGHARGTSEAVARGGQERRSRDAPGRGRTQGSRPKIAKPWPQPGPHGVPLDNPKTPAPLIPHQRGHQNTLPALGDTRLCRHPLGTEGPASPGSVPLPSRLYLWRTHSNLITIIFSINCCWRCSR